MAWLSGWNKRIEIKIEDYAGDIGAAVTWFPVTVFLTATQGEEVFVELTTDAEYKKVAFTKADGETELYGECELFDVSEELGIYHISRDGWVINANTSIYMYYDKDHADNDAYIGAITARTEVWDGNTEGHWDMAQDPNGDGANAIKDGTSNTRHLTPAGTMLTEDLVDAKIGKGIDFEGTDDELNKASADVGITNASTISAWVKLDTDRNATIFETLTTGAADNINRIRLLRLVDDTVEGALYDSNGDLFKGYCSNGTISTGTWYHVASTWDGTNFHIYIDGLQSTPYLKNVDNAGTMTKTNRMINIGHVISLLFWDGILDEMSYASVARSAAWIKGLYNSGNDSLFTYGSEELGSILKELDEAFSAVDSIASSADKALSEAFSVADSWVARINLAEAISIADSLFKNGIKQLVEAFSIVDSWVARLNLSEVFSVADGLTKNAVKNLSDALNIVDSKSTNVDKSLNESFTIADSWTMIRRFTETLKIADSIIKKHIITMMIRKIIIRVRGGSYESDIELED